MNGVRERLGIVVIGRNESPRLERTLAALTGRGWRVIYVDSGSSDGSPEIAEKIGVSVIRLTDGPFTAARGRTAGFERLSADNPGLDFVQFVDGDCEMAPGWLDDGAAFLDADPRVGAVAGRLREQNAGTSFLVRLVDIEWDLPEGPTDVIGGISLIRARALSEVGGWRADLVAGEELDLSSRLRGAGYTLHRLARDMCRHDIGITRFGEFWKRSVRTGHSYAQLALLHRATGPKRWLKRTAGHLAYGLFLPLAFLVLVFAYWPAALLIGAVYLLLIIRLTRWRIVSGDPAKVAVAYALVTTVCKVAAGLGVLKFLKSRLTGRRSTLIEYKAAPEPGGGR